MLNLQVIDAEEKLIEHTNLTAYVVDEETCIVLNEFCITNHSTTLCNMKLCVNSTEYVISVVWIHSYK